ncbi:MAG: zinc ribbon domain-containing protein [Phycisphaerae bacterium]
MPTYDYECQACGEKFEQFQSIVALPIRKCPACKKNKVRRLIGTGAGIIFKGSGFYQTDYRSDSYRKGAEKEKSDSSGSSSSSSSSAASTGDSKAKDSTPAKPKKKDK